MSWADVVMKAMNVIHRAVLKLSGGRLGWTLGRMTAVELHTIGRTSGKRRSTMLSAPISDDERIVLVASRGGADRHPQWYLNLAANPDVDITIRDQTFQMRARTATPVEKAELWPTITTVNPGYAGYQRKTDRDIPVVICEPREPEAPPS
jgi:deazaflavin-dependent oxidoreductase (nitroreductase family)